MKKVLSLLLAAILVISLIPMTVFAAGEPTISFETTFTEDMEKDDEFTVTAKLANNPGIYTMTLTLKWDDAVVKFEGFETEYDEDEEADVLVSDVFGALPGGFNNENGMVTGTRTNANNTSKEGELFTAKFKIIGSGKPAIGLKTDDATEFEIANIDDENVAVTIDYSAIENLTVAGGDEGPAIPDDAPFTAITTDAGAVIAIEQQEDMDVPDYNTVPWYHITIPEKATEVYVTDPDQLIMEDYTSHEMKAMAYYIDLSESMTYTNSYAYEETADGVKVIIPMDMIATNMYGDEVEVYFPAVDEEILYAYAGEDSNYAATFALTFEYGTAGGEEETTYNITVQQTTGGTVTVYDENSHEITEAKAGDAVLLANTPAAGYRFVHYLINGVTVTEADLGMANGFYTMPAEAVEISAVFEKITYGITVNTAEHGTVSADKATAAAGEKVTLTVAPAEGYVLDTLTVMQGETPVEVTNNAFTMPAGTVTVTATFKVKVEGYTFATSADVSATNAETVDVHVKITGHSDENVTKFNAYDVTLTFDSEKLELAKDDEGNYIYSGAVKSDGGEVKVEGNTIRIVGCGADKGFGIEIATLTFKIKENAEGSANVTISKVQVSDKEEAVEDNAPVATPGHAENDENADETPAESVILIPYSVTKPEFISGSDKVIGGNDYTFSYTDTTNYTYKDLTVTVDGTPVTPTETGGVYTVANVTGSVVITATQTPNSYDVTVVKPEGVAFTGGEKATYGTKYEFTVAPSADTKVIDSVTITEGINFAVKDGVYTIAGTDITKAFTITITETDKYTAVTFEGIKAEEIEGGQLTQSAEIGKDFTFKLIKEEGFDYTVKVGETVLTETDGSYTISAELVVAGGITVTIEKVDNTTAVVEVTEYIKLDDKSMFLVTAKWGDKVLAYGDEGTMYYSSEYTVTGEEEAGAYCWLVISDKSAAEVKTDAEAAIVAAAEGVEATDVEYDFDVNGTTIVDVNDAQLVYDMYKAEYAEFTENLTMLKFLEADLNGSKTLDTQDVAAVVNYVVQH